MASYQHRHPGAPDERLIITALSGLQQYLTTFTSSNLLRMCLVITIVTGSLLSARALLLPTTANAAHLIQHAYKAQTSTPHKVAPQHPQQQSSSPLFQALTSTSPTAPLDVSSSQPFDGLGNLPFYTYVKHPINSPSCSCGKREILVNAANGNLLLHSVDLQITGTAGLDLDIEGYYNSLGDTSFALDHGKKWTLSVGHDLRLDTSNASKGITLFGPSGYAAFFAFDSSNNKYTDAPGLNATLKKDSNDKYTLTFHQTGQQWIFGADNGQHLTTIQDQNNNQIKISYDSSFDVTSITNTQSRAITFAHNTAYGTSHHPQGEITQITDPAGNTVTYSYDSNNNLISTTDLDGNTTTYGYNSTDLTSITDALGNSTQITYDSKHRATSITDPLDGVTKFDYKSSETDVTDANGHKSTYDYDSNLKVTKTTDAEGFTRKTSYDVTNYNVTQQLDALGNATSYAFDTANNVTSVTDGNNNQVKLKYDDSKHPFYPTSATDKQGNTIKYTYSDPGNLTDVEDGLDSQNRIHYNYNSDGTLQKITDAAGNIITYGYDSKGNLTSVTPPAPLGSESLSYDALSHITSVTDGKGQTTTYTYNNLNKVTKITYADRSTISYQYDADNNLVSETDHTGTTTFTYDALNRVIQKTLPGGATISYSYDGVGNLTSYTDAGGTVTYAYNKDNLITTLTEPGGAQTKYSYDGDENNRLRSMQYPNGVTVKFNLDNDDHKTDIVATDASGNKLMSFNYSFKGDLQTSVTDLNSNKTSYSYDALNRLTKATTTDSSGNQTNEFAYSYDGPGNLLSIKAKGQTQGTFSYNAANELTSSVQNGTTTLYSYDANGSMISGLNLNFTYNAQNQTTAIGSNTFAYTGADQTDRVQANGTSYTNSSLGLGSATDSNGSTFYTRDPKGQLISERTPTGTYYYLLDHIGSVRVVTDSSGNVKNTYTYDPLGNSLSKTEQVANPWQFASGYFDASTGLYKFGMRYYSPQIGRWTQQDPVGIKLSDPNSPNRYVYTEDDPINFVDQNGAFCYTLVQVLTVAVIAFAVIALIAGLMALGPESLLTIGALTLSLRTTFAVIGLVNGFLGTVTSALTNVIPNRTFCFGS